MEYTEIALLEAIVTYGENLTVHFTPVRCVSSPHLHISAEDLLHIGREFFELIIGVDNFSVSST